MDGGYRILFERGMEPEVPKAEKRNIEDAIGGFSGGAKSLTIFFDIS